jgi:uncharacterized protein YjbJ (UPF0337 family)
MNKFTFDGSWNEIKGKLRQKYAQLTDDDLQFAEGKAEELLGKLQARLGVGADHLQKTLSELKNEVEAAADSVSGKYEAAKHKVAEVAHDVTAKVSEKAGAVYDDACHKAHTWRDEGEAYVREQPRTALVSALVAGFLIGLLIRR